jgi:hypothetical protein
LTWDAAVAAVTAIAMAAVVSEEAGALGTPVLANAELWVARLVMAALAMVALLGHWLVEALDRQPGRRRQG